MDEKRAGLDREELERAGVRARSRLDHIEAHVAALSWEELETSFHEVREALLDTGGPVEQLTRDLLAHREIAPGRRASVVGGDTCLWELLATLEVMLDRLRHESNGAHHGVPGIGP